MLSVTTATVCQVFRCWLKTKAIYLLWDLKDQTSVPCICYPACRKSSGKQTDWAKKRKSMNILAQAETGLLRMATQWRDTLWRTVTEWQSRSMDLKIIEVVQCSQLRTFFFFFAKRLRAKLHFLSSTTHRFYFYFLIAHILRGITNTLELKTVKWAVWVDKPVNSVQMCFYPSNSEWQKSTGAIDMCEWFSQALREGFIQLAVTSTSYKRLWWMDFDGIDVIGTDVWSTRLLRIFLANMVHT